MWQDTQGTGEAKIAKTPPLAQMAFQVGVACAELGMTTERVSGLDSAEDEKIGVLRTAAELRAEQTFVRHVMQTRTQKVVSRNRLWVRWTVQQSAWDSETQPNTVRGPETTQVQEQVQGRENGDEQVRSCSSSTRVRTSGRNNNMEPQDATEQTWSAVSGSHLE